MSTVYRSDLPIAQRLPDSGRTRLGSAPIRSAPRELRLYRADRLGPSGRFQSALLRELLQPAPLHIRVVHACHADLRGSPGCAARGWKAAEGRTGATQTSADEIDPQPSRNTRDWTWHGPACKYVLCSMPFEISS
jgi:hypothetical protein